MSDYVPKHRGDPQPEYTHKPKADGTCSLWCTCPTPLTDEEYELLDAIGAY